MPIGGLGTLAKNEEGIRGIHALMTPEEALAKVREIKLRGDSGPGSSRRAARLTVNSRQVQEYLQKQNSHANRYATDPAYKREWDRTHGGGIESVAKGIGSHVKQSWDALRENPERALLGIGDELTTNVWNQALGTDYDPLSTPFGGATDEQIAEMQRQGIATNNFEGLNNIADTVTGLYAGNALSNLGSGSQGTTNALDAFGGSGAPVSTPTGFSSPGTFGGTTAGATAAASQLPGSSSSGGGNMPSSNWLDNALIGGSSLLSGYLSNQATEKGIDEIGRQYDLTRADFAPWREAGVNALGKLENFDIDTVRSDPLYQLQNEEALRAINRGNSARGLNLSGNALIDEARTAADISSNYGNNLWNRQAGLAGVGQTATASGAQMGQNSANNLSNLYLQQGQGINNAIQGGLSNYFTSNYLRR